MSGESRSFPVGFSYGSFNALLWMVRQAITDPVVERGAWRHCSERSTSECGSWHWTSWCRHCRCWLEACCQWNTPRGCCQWCYCRAMMLNANSALMPCSGFWQWCTAFVSHRTLLRLRQIWVWCCCPEAGLSFSLPPLVLLSFHWSFFSFYHSTNSFR